jgi:ferrochelatase
VAQLEEASGLVAARLRSRHPRALVFQSRSGSPSQPWLEPDVGDHLTALRAEGVTDVVLVPIGFVSDHLEVRWDLDTEAAARARGLGMRLVRAVTVGTHPRFVAMIRDLVLERTEGSPRLSLGRGGPAPDLCAPGCCPAPVRPPATPRN